MSDQPTPTPDIVSRITDGLQTRDDTAREFRVALRTIQRWEDLGLPVIKVGNKRYHNPASARAWLLAHERRHDLPKRGRPAKQAA